jgi:hypothetical protein
MLWVAEGRLLALLLCGLALLFLRLAVKGMLHRGPH